MTSRIWLMIAWTVGASICEAQYTYSLRDNSDQIYQNYLKQVDAAKASGFAYKTQAAKNRDLQAIQQQINQAKRQGTDWTPAHRTQLKMLQHGYNEVLKTPVNASGGSGRWQGNAQQRMQESMKMAQQFLEDYQNLLKEFDRIREQAQQQMARDNAHYQQLQKQGVSALQQTGQAGLNTLDAIEADERKAQRQQQLAEMQRMLQQTTLEAYRQELIDQLNTLGESWNSPLALGGLIPGLNDPSLINGLTDPNNFVPLDPNDFGSGSGEFTENNEWPAPQARLLRDQNGNYMDPANAPWGTYNGDTDCGDGVITGLGRDIAIAEYKRLTSDNPDDPRLAPAFHFPDDVLSSVTGVANGRTRQQAIDEYDQRMAAENAAKAAEEKAAKEAEDAYQAILKKRIPPTSPTYPLYPPVPKKPKDRTAPHITPWKLDPEDDPNPSNLPPAPEKSLKDQISEAYDGLKQSLFPDKETKKDPYGLIGLDDFLNPKKDK